MYVCRYTVLLGVNTLGRMDGSNESKVIPKPLTILRERGGGDIAYLYTLFYFIIRFLLTAPIPCGLFGLRVLLSFCQSYLRVCLGRGEGVKKSGWQKQIAGVRMMMEGHGGCVAQYYICVSSGS